VEGRISISGVVEGKNVRCQKEENKIKMCEGSRSFFILSIADLAVLYKRSKYMYNWIISLSELSHSPPLPG